MTLRNRAGWAEYFLSKCPPRFDSSSSMRTREIEVSADSDAARNPANPISATIVMTETRSTRTLPIPSLIFPEVQTLLFHLPDWRGHIQEYAINRVLPK